MLESLEEYREVIHGKKTSEKEKRDFGIKAEEAFWHA